MILLACDKDEGDGHVFNAVDEVSFTVKDTITMVANEMGYDVEIVEISHPLAYEMAAGYAPRRSSQVNIFNLKSILGYRDAVSPYEGIRRSTRWMLDNWEKLDHSQLQLLMKDPPAYSEEDALIASVKVWQQKASDSIRLPDVPDLAEGDWRGAFTP